jgi:hypothetical protein
MGDLASDHDAAIELIISEYQRLQSHDPKHELLQYITDVNNEGFTQVGDKYEEFLDRFETPEDKKLDYIKRAKVLASYFVALRDVVSKIEGIDKSRNKEQLANSTPIKNLEEGIEEIPF